MLRYCGKLAFNLPAKRMLAIVRIFKVRIIVFASKRIVRMDRKCTALSSDGDSNADCVWTCTHGG